ncbi:DUF3592 domain-containing protein [Actinomadura macrotermitis]|uniref:DUF3592 domain-containing protein n=1 Tax=Actinomadura macrotermitis TaxID=2585200 RepID=A0A7K0BRM2_9ACTN|nr:DUF3592 domain-containing protein [Actinomadura macrotermitis]MQY03840.1 hypothetical protein [Actinomadura macrotermitis]
MIVTILGLLFGGAFALGGVKEIADRVRLQRRSRRARGVFVAREEVGSVAHPGVRSRAVRFRFSTETGRVVERTSALTSFPGPRPGREVTVVYDPARPESTAERAGVHLALLFLAGPVLIALGVTMILMTWRAG